MKRRRVLALFVALGAALLILAAPSVKNPAVAQTGSVCVNPGGTGGCMSTIQAAVNAASPGATVSVAAGTYNEMVTISQPLRLIGAGMASTTINANGKDNGVHIAADHVWLQGFTISGARLDGVLVNGNDATIIDNTITGNATLVIPPPPGAPPVPATWNGLNLQNSSYALVAYNNVSKNAGRGIRTEGSAIYNYPDQGINQVIEGRSDHNLIIGNTVDSNGAACGIVLSTDSSDNVVEGNTSTNNPAGIIVAVLPPFGLPNTPFAGHIPHSDRNVIANNDVENNIGLGINIDAKSGTDNDSVVSGNTVMNNGVAAESNGQTVGIQVNGAPGTQVDGTVVMGNTVSGQQIDMWVVPNSSATNTVGIPASAPSTSTTPAASTPIPAATSTTDVTIVRFTFQPQTVSVPAGSTVVWTNQDTTQHSATAADGSWDTGLLSQGQSGSITFDNPGTYQYICSIHPFMTGTIVVQ